MYSRFTVFSVGCYSLEISLAHTTARISGRRAPRWLRFKAFESPRIIPHRPLRKIVKEIRIPYSFWSPTEWFEILLFRVVRLLSLVCRVLPCICCSILHYCFEAVIGIFHGTITISLVRLCIVWFDEFGVSAAVSWFLFQSQAAGLMVVFAPPTATRLGA